MGENERRNPYIDEQLLGAVSTLVSGRGRIQERLTAAATYRLVHLQVEWFPLDLREDAIRVFELLRSSPEGGFPAAIQAMTEDEASRLASDIHDLQLRHETYWDERERR